MLHGPQSKGGARNEDSVLRPRHARPIANPTAAPSHSVTGVTFRPTTSGPSANVTTATDTATPVTRSRRPHSPTPSNPPPTHSALIIFRAHGGKLSGKKMSVHAAPIVWPRPQVVLMHSRVAITVTVSPSRAPARAPGARRSGRARRSSLAWLRYVIKRSV